MVATMPDQKNLVNSSVVTPSTDSNSPQVETPPQFDPLDPPARKPLSKVAVVSLTFLTMLVLGVVGWYWLANQYMNGLQDMDVNQVSLTAPISTDSAFSYVPENTAFIPRSAHTPATLAELNNLANFEQTIPLTDAQKQQLEQQQFVVVQNTNQFFQKDPAAPTGRTDDWTYLYGDIGGGHITERRPENAVFITTDFALHIFHRLLEKELEYIEKTTLYKKLSSLTNNLYEQSVLGYNSANNPQEKASFARLTAFFVVPKVMLDTSYEDLEREPADSGSDKIETMLIKLKNLEGEMSPSAYQQAGQELNLIIEAKEMVDSPLFGQLQAEAGFQMAEDYSQYQPRSHYNKNALLRTYFRTMMWYGRANFLVKSPELTRDALHIVAFFQDPQLQTTWKSISDPITFLVGASDDLTWLDYQPVRAQFNTTALTANQITEAMTTIGKLRSPVIQGSVIVDPKVMSTSKADLQEATKGFRLFGQRSVADAVIFSTLTQGQESADPTTGQKLPSTTTSLFVMSALDLPSVEPLAQEWIVNNAPDSDKVLANRRQELTTNFGQMDEAAWTKNVYWSWLYAIKALGLQPAELAGYPAFMQGEGWQRKNLQTALGTWTELKHDTLLYAKQSYAEMGAGGEPPTPPPVPKGYVEPNVVLFDRLIALQKMKQKGLAAYGLMDGMFESRNQDLLAGLEFFRDLAVKELEGTAISDDEFEQLRNQAKLMNWIAAVLPGEEQTESAARTALVADVHTDVVRGKILYQANSMPDFIYVMVKDNNGARLTKGLVYRHYEFEESLGKRLTDEQWQGRVYEGGNPLPAIAPWAAALRR